MLTELLQALADEDRREDALEQLSDYFESGAWSPAQVRPALAELVSDLAGMSPSAREATLNALLAAAHRNPEALADVPFETLVALLHDENLERPLVPYVLELLGLSGQADLATAIEPFKSNDDEEVASAAEAALTMLAASSPG